MVRGLTAVENVHVVKPSGAAGSPKEHKRVLSREYKGMPRPCLGKHPLLPHHLPALKLCCCIMWWGGHQHTASAYGRPRACADLV